MPAQPTLFELVSTHIYTTSDIARLEESIDRFLGVLYMADSKSVNEKMDETLPHTFSEIVKDALATTHTPMSNIEDIKAVITHLRESLSALKAVSLTLAFDPPQKTIEKLSSFVKENFGKDHVLELSFSPQILGGAVIVSNGKYLDLSLKKKLDILFEAKQKEITGMLQ